MKEYTLERLAQTVPEIHRVGEGEAPHILCLTLPGYKSEVLVRVLGDQGICISAGSACHRGKPSHVFAAMPIGKPAMEGSFRVSFGKETTREEIDQLVTALAHAKETLFPSMS
jgi:cysteine desulfurase